MGQGPRILGYTQYGQLGRKHFSALLLKSAFYMSLFKIVKL